MGRDGQAAQDNELRRIERINKQCPDERKPKVQSLKEQLDEEAKLKALTPQQRMAAKSWYDWEHDLRDILRESKTVSVPTHTYEKIMSRYNTEMHKMHEEGLSYKLVIAWIIEKGDEFIGWR